MMNKLRGGYYTPAPLAHWLTDWAVQSASDRVLEPSCGDGVFVHQAAQKLLSYGANPKRVAKQLFAVEIESCESQKAVDHLTRVLGPHKIEMFTGDFFEWSNSNRNYLVNCVIGNPPFIRYHNFPDAPRTRAMSIMREAGLTPNRLTNIWVPFVVAAVNHLAPGGRLAMVLPAELLQVSYSAQLRLFLVDRFSELEIVSCNDLELIPEPYDR